MNPFETLVRLPTAALEFSNILLTTDDAPIGVSPKDLVWTHRKTSLYRYRSNNRQHPVPVLLVFALINRPFIFDLRPGNSFVEFLLEEGFDVFLVDWGVPDDEDADMGVENFVCEEIHWAVRETRRAAGQDQVSIVGWCIGATLSAMYASLLGAGVLRPVDAVRNLVLLTMPIDPRDNVYTTWVGRPSFDVDQVADTFPTVSGRGIDWANKLMKPVTNYWTTYRNLWQQVLEGTANRTAYQAMAKWVADNPPFPARAYREWITWMYKENRLIRGRLRLRDHPVDLHDVDQSLLVVTAGADHIAPRHTTVPVLDLVGSTDATYFDRPGGHIGLMAGSKAREEIWPDIAEWLAKRSGAALDRKE